MTNIVNYIVDGYNYIFHDSVSPVTRDWFLVGKPYQLLCLMIAYRYFCTSLGPRLMQHRRPYNLTNIIVVYNLFQILLSIYLVFQGSMYLYLIKFDFNCQGLENDEDTAKWIASLVWLYYMAKISELLDTLFFVLRKSNRQISSLHLHHHTLMPFSGWIGSTYMPGSQGALVGWLNTIVHIVMYTYYLIAGFGDNYKKLLWWKKYVTLLQLIQFVLIALHSLNSLFYTCNFSVVYKLLILCYALFFLRMFGKFYIDNYIKVKKNNRAKRSE